MTLFKWSRTASSNASADASINWAEGQPPSSVNDSARAMMAAAAKYRDDVAGAITTSGTATTYTVTSYQGFDALAHLDGQMIAFTPHTGNGAIVTLNVDSTGAKPLRPAPGIELPTGALIQGTPYLAVYSNSDGVFYLRGGAPYPYLIPLGGLLPYIGSSAPNSAFALPFGQAISRATYSALFSVIGTTFGSGDGSTTFNLPDLRGRVIAGLDNMGGSSAARLSAAISSSTMGAVGGAQNQGISQGNLPNVNFNVTDTHRHQAEASDQGYSTAYAVTVNSTGSVVVNPGAVQAIYVQGSGQSFVNMSTTLTSPTVSGSITVNSAGSGVALNTTQPTMVVNFILRII
jgi:microcystin-dependent protein